AGGEHDDAARVPDSEGGPDVLAEVQLLQRQRIGRVAGDQPVDLLVYVRQTPLDRRLRGRAYDAAVERHEPAFALCDDAVARVRETGVDAEDDHDAGFCACLRTPAWRTLRA